MKSCLLINLPSLYIYENIINTFKIFPSGLLAIGRLLKKNNYRYSFYDFNLKWDNMYLKRFTKFLLRKGSFDYILISLRQWDGFFFPEGLIRNIPLKDINLSILEPILRKVLLIKPKKIIMGGPALTIYEKGLKDIFSKYVDKFIYGRGELKLSNFLNLKKTTYEQPLLTNIDDYDEIGIPTHTKCGNRCIYCPYPSIEKKLNFYNISEIIKNLEFLNNKNIFFADSVFNNNNHFVKKLLRLIIKKNISIKWRAYFNPIIDSELINLLKKSNCQKVILSPDSFDPNVAKKLGKPFNPDITKKVINNLLKNDINVTVNLINNHLWENQKSLINDISYVKKVKKKYDKFKFWLTPVRITPKTPISRYLNINEKNLLNPIFFTDTKYYNEIVYSYREAFKKEGNPVKNQNYEKFFDIFSEILYKEINK